MNRELLVEKYVEGTLSAQEKAQLNDELQNDAEFGQEFVEHMADVSLMADVGFQELSARREKKAKNPARKTARNHGAVRRRPPYTRPRQSNRRTLTFSAFAAAAAFIIVGIVTYVVNKQSSATARLTVARVRGTATAGGKGATRTLKAGDKVQLGEIVSADKHSSILVHYEDGSGILVQTSSTIRLGTGRAKHVSITDGAASFNVAPQDANRPFTISTPHSQTTVVGTMFTLTVRPSSTKLDVDKGVVEFLDRTKNKSQTVQAGESAVAGRANRIVQAPLLPRRPAPKIVPKPEPKPDVPVALTLGLLDDRNQPIPGCEKLAADATLKINEIGEKHYNFVVNAPDNVAQMITRVNFTTQNGKTTAIRDANETLIPFQVFGNEATWLFPGSYEIRLTPLLVDGSRGKTVTHRIKIDAGPAKKSDQRILKEFRLIDVDRIKFIKKFSPIKDNCTIKLSELPTQNLNIRIMTTEGASVVKFWMFRETSSGYVIQEHHNREYVYPFFFFGDCYNKGEPDIPNAGKLRPGTYILYAVAVDESYQPEQNLDSRCIRFTVVK